MTLRHITIFLCVCEEQSITKAAKKLYIAQPSVSLVIAELEAHYQVKLFDRISRRMDITEAGRKLYEHGTQLLQAYHLMEQQMLVIEEGELKVGVSITIANFILPQVVKQFNVMYPKIQIHVVVDHSEQIQKWIVENKIDLGMIEGPLHTKYVAYEKAQEDELYIVCGQDYPLKQGECLSITELSKHDLLVRNQGSGGRDVIERIFHEHSMKLEPIWESSSSTAIINAIRCGLGIAILPKRFVEAEINKSLKQIFCEGVTFTRQIHVVYHQNKYLTPPLQEFITLLKAEKL